MDRLVFSSHSAVAEQTRARQHLVNELANISTTGFKRSYHLAMSSVKAEGPGFDTRYHTQSFETDTIDLTPGSMMVTGRPLDIAMANKTVMGVQAENGELAFSRRGDLRVTATGLLEDGSGRAVMGEGGVINIPPGFDVRINKDGTVFARDPADPAAEEAFIDQIMLRDASQTELRRREDGLFAVFGQPVGSDFASGPNGVEVVTGSLEGSNVNAIYAMTKLIDHARTFEAQIRVIKEAKGLDESGSTMMRNS
jgi:flagellar basal-body rod protein FlgF